MSASQAKQLLLLALCIIGFLLFTALGIWQVERLGWKLALIARVDQRIHAPPIAVPPPGQWSMLGPQALEYRHVVVAGRFRHEQETLVDALTERGAGYWVLTPLVTRAGTILINRGFVPSSHTDRRTRAAGNIDAPVTIVGLLRQSEPRGRVLRRNNPAANRWYSRDVVAIAKARGLGAVEPFFIDADSAPNSGGLPIGGLTVVVFRNAHLVYALTWFALAALSLGGLVIIRKSAQEPS
ncbi:MAG: SURF1 family protein [Novosphingobium sp.]